MHSKSALGKGLGALIPQKGSPTAQVIREINQEVLQIELEKIQANPRQPRLHFSASDLEDLIASIKEYGILQPIVVTRSQDGFELIAGERRLRASRALGLKTIPALVRDATEQQKLELALIENIQRADLNVVEEAFAYQALIDEFNLTQQVVADRVGKSRPVIANALRLLELPEEILDALKEGRIGKTHARTLLSETHPDKQRIMFERMLRGDMTTREAEIKSTGIMPKREKKGKDPNIVAHERSLREILGTKIIIDERAGKGKLSIHFFSKEELLDLLSRLSTL